MLNLEEKFRYSEWDIDIRKTENNENAYVFQAKDIDRFKRHVIANVRRSYRMTTLVNRDIEENKELAIKAIKQLACTVNIYDSKFMMLDKELYNSAKLLVGSITQSFRSVTKDFYLRCNFDGIKADDVINTYEYLYTISKI